MTDGESTQRPPTKAEERRRTKKLRKIEAFMHRREQHPNPEAYETMLETILEAEEGQSSTDFELDTSAAFDYAFERLHEQGDD